MGMGTQFEFAEDLYWHQLALSFPSAPQVINKKPIDHLQNCTRSENTKVSLSKTQVPAEATSSGPDAPAYRGGLRWEMTETIHYEQCPPIVAFKSIT